ncbi:LysR family transcriptional regulator [Eubacterium sp. F2]|uniref:LysR family transcriptional regulator n=1 Tax=Eubacterium sp. F2 TaxID=3381348 RepID=UPI0039082FF7
MELRQLRHFLVIAEEGSISAAARRLHLSQPPLSRQMSLLEAECGLILFHRGSREITLTEAGRVLQRYASQMLETEDSIFDEMNDLKKGRRGVVRIGLISSAAGDAVCRMLSRAKRKFPIFSCDCMREIPMKFWTC